MEDAALNVPDKRKVVRYHELRDCKVGHRALVWPIDHPAIPVGKFGKTTMVQSFDPLTGVAETANTRYEPGPFAQWTESRNDTTRLTYDLDTNVSPMSIHSEAKFD
jgi:hypothetical protein